MINTNNENKLKLYTNFLKSTDNTEETNKHTIQVLRSYLSKLKTKPLEKTKEQDIINYLSKFNETTFSPRLSIIRKFYRYTLKIDDNTLPPFLKRIKLKSNLKIRRKREILYREKLVSDEKYHQLIDHAKTYQHKAIIETFKLFGLRNSELRNMKINGVTYNNGLTKITIPKSKTTPRESIYDGRAEHLLTWIENYHPNRIDKNSYVFTSINNKQYTSPGIYLILRRTAELAKLKPIKPHDLRHTYITNARKNGIPDTHIENNTGLIQHSDMIKVYDHNQIKDYEEWLIQRQQDTKPTYESLKKQKQELETKQQKEIEELKKKMVTIDDIAPLIIELFKKAGKNIEDIKQENLYKNLKFLKEQKTKISKTNQTIQTN